VDAVKKGQKRWGNKADHASIFADILRLETEKIWMFYLKISILA
jgi:hypothetical protein